MNQLDPSESDITRGERQQAVTQAIAHKMLSPLTMLKLPFIGDDLVAPLSTDLSTWQLTQLAWAKFRGDDDRALHCRLGGEDAGGVLIPTEDNRNVVSMFVGASAPQPRSRVALRARLPRRLEPVGLGGIGGMPFVDVVRCSVCGKDAGSADSSAIGATEDAVRRASSVRRRHNAYSAKPS